MIGGRGLCPQTPAVAPSAALHPASVAPHTADLISLHSLSTPLPDQTCISKIPNFCYIIVKELLRRLKL